MISESLFKSMDPKDIRVQLIYNMRACVRFREDFREIRSKFSDYFLVDFHPNA